MFLSVGGTCIVQIINFLVFFALLNVVFLRPVGRAIVARRARIDAIASDYASAQAETLALRTQGQSRRHAASREAEDLIAKARAAANIEAESIIVRAQALAHERKTHAQATIAGESAVAEQRVEILVDDLAQQLFDRAVGVRQ